LHYAFAVKLLIALALACAPIFTQTLLAQTCASPTPIEITGPVNALSGPMTGTINLLMSYTMPGNPPVVQSQMQVQVTAGAMLVCLPAGAAVVASYSVPNPSPLTGTTRFTRFWAVPASGGPYTLYSGVETVIPSTPNLFVSWGQLPQPPATGTYCLGAVTGAIGWDSCSGGGGSFPAVTNLIKGDGAGNGADSGIVPSTVLLSTGTYNNPSWLTGLAWAKLTGVPSYEPAISAGTTAQYWRGDKSWQSFSGSVLPLLSATGALSYNSSTGVFTCPSCLTTNAVTSVFGRTGAVTAQSGVSCLYARQEVFFHQRSREDIGRFASYRRFLGKDQVDRAFHRRCARRGNRSKVQLRRSSPAADGA